MGYTSMSLTVFNDDYTLNIDSFYSNMAVTIKASKAQMQNLGVYKEGWKSKTPFEKVTTNLAMEGNDLVKIPSTPFILYRIEIPSNIDFLAFIAVISYCIAKSHFVCAAAESIKFNIIL